MITSIRKQIKEEALKANPFECCGFIVLDKYEPKILPIKNIAYDPLNTFRMPDETYLITKSKYEIIGIYHSHPSPNHDESFSESDIEASEVNQLPYYLYNVVSDKFYSYLPKNYYINLIGKPFIWGIYDCFSAVRYYYRQNLNILLEDYERNDSFFEKPGTLITDEFEKNGFRKLQSLNLCQPHDIFVFYGPTMIPQHLAVYTNHNKILHHKLNRLCGLDTLTSFGNKIAFILRHKSL